MFTNSKSRKLKPGLPDWARFPQPNLATLAAAVEPCNPRPSYGVARLDWGEIWPNLATPVRFLPLWLQASVSSSSVIRTAIRRLSVGAESPELTGI